MSVECKHNWLFVKQVQQWKSEAHKLKAEGQGFGLYGGFSFPYINEGRKYICASCGEAREVF